MRTILNQCQCDCWRDKRRLCGRCVYTFPVKTMNLYIFHSFEYFVDRLYLVLKRLCAWLFHNSNYFVCNAKICPGSKIYSFYYAVHFKKGYIIINTRDRQSYFRYQEYLGLRKVVQSINVILCIMHMHYLSLLFVCKSSFLWGPLSRTVYHRRYV